jgi:hypothetical protein
LSKVEFSSLPWDLNLAQLLHFSFIVVRLLPDVFRVRMNGMFALLFDY